MSGVTIADIQKKILEKVEQKYKGGVSKERLARIFNEKDKDKDGFVSQVEFIAALQEGGGNPVSDMEAEFLFTFWDTLAGQKDPQGAVEVVMAVEDLMAAMPTYSTGFNSGDLGIKANKGAKGNLPSQAGGIFGGGSYEADAMNEKVGRPGGAPVNDVAMGVQEMPPRAEPNAGRPKGNQSSVVGGIFSLVGVALFQRTMSTWNFRPVFWVTSAVNDGILVAF